MKVKINTDIPGENSKKLLKKSDKIGKTQLLSLYGIVFDSGYGAYITDVDSNTYLDFVSGAAVCNIGYGRSDVMEVYANTAQRLQHSFYPHSLNKEAIDLAEKLIEITPGTFDKAVLFGLSGSSSMDGAIKAARKYTGKRGIISFKNSYHSNTGFGILASGYSNLTEGLFLNDDSFYCVEFPTNEEEMNSTLNCIENILKFNDIAAIISEPIQGDAGVLIPPKSFFKKLHSLVQDYDALFIADEIQSGSGRTGRWWAIEHFDAVPDLLVCAKGISGGYAPFSAVIGEKEIINSLNKLQHIFTYSGHPPSCAVTKKVIDIIQEEKLMKNAQNIGKLLLNNLKKLEGHDVVLESRGCGLMIGLELKDKDKAIAKIAGMRCVEHGLYPGYYGVHTDVMRLQPPLILNKEEALWASEIIKKVIVEMENNQTPMYTQEKCKKYAIGMM